MENDTCRWPRCRNVRWVSRGYAICGMHARFIYEAMKPEGPPVDLVARVRQLETIVQAKEQRIRELEGPRPEPKPTPPPAPTDGTVYVLRCGGFIKIGWTSDLSKRMRSYQPDSVLLATMPGTRKDENRLHKRFAHLRSHGREWYPIAPQITEYVALMVEEHGVPDPVAFAAQPVQVRRSRPPSHVGGNHRGPYGRSGIVPTGLTR